MKMNAAKPILPTSSPHSTIAPRPQARRQAPQAAITTAGETAELLIYDDIGEFWGMGIGAESVVKDLSALGDDVKSLTVRINSPGGDVFDGAAIYNALARLRIPVNIEIDGLAASISSIIAMAGDTITMAANAMMMVHNPWMFSMGDAEVLRSDAHVLDQVQAGLVRIYAARTGQQDSIITDLMDAETWMTADEAMAHGFCDETTDPVSIAAHADLARYKFKHVPEAWTDPADPPPPRASYKDRIAALAQRRSEI